MEDTDLIEPGQLWRHKDADGSLEVISFADDGCFRVKLRSDFIDEERVVTEAFIREFYPALLGRWKRG